MGNFFRNRDVRRLAGGVAVAAAAGLMMGAALKPNLDEEPLEGPQQLITGGGPRTYAQAADPGVTAYRGEMPAYVVGTDHLARLEPAVLAYEDRFEPEVVAAPASEYASNVMAYEAPTVRPSQWVEEPRPEPHYPSQSGGGWNESDLPPAPEAAYDDAVDDDAPY